MYDMTEIVWSQLQSTHPGNLNFSSYLNKDSLKIWSKPTHLFDICNIRIQSYNYDYFTRLYVRFGCKKSYNLKYDAK